MRIAQVHGTLLLVLTLTLGGCSSNRLLSSWKAPGAQAASFRKVMVVAPAKDPALRRSAEDAMAKKIAGAVPAYQVVPEAELGDDEAVRARARSAGFDGAVVMRVVAVDEQQTWVPGTWSGYPYVHGGWAGYDPGYVRTDTLVRVETNVYSLPGDKLEWASVTQKVNPSSVNSLVKGTAKTVSKAMRKDGFLPDDQ
jgi:hypothetical protein